MTKTEKAEVYSLAESVDEHLKGLLEKFSLSLAYDHLYPGENK